MLQAHRLSQGAAVRIAVIDTGVDYRHPDLRGRVIARLDFVGRRSDDFTADRHGTQVAGVIAATADGGQGVLGIAPESRLIVLKACWPLQQDAAEAACDSFTLAQALEAAIAAHADVVNLSLAGPPDPLLARLIEYGMRQGIIYVGAVAPPTSRLTHSFPVAIPGVLAVQSAEDAAATSRAPAGPRPRHPDTDSGRPLRLRLGQLPRNRRGHRNRGPSARRRQAARRSESRTDPHPQLTAVHHARGRIQVRQCLRSRRRCDAAHQLPDRRRGDRPRRYRGAATDRSRTPARNPHTARSGSEESVQLDEPEPRVLRRRPRGPL